LNLTAKHYRLIELLTDATDTRGFVAKSKAAGFAGSYYTELLKKPDFAKALAEARETALGGPALLRADCSLVHDMDSKNFDERHKAREQFYKRMGFFGQGTNITTNVIQNAPEQFPDRLREWTRERAEVSE
jgi:hypothetical protein